MLKNLVFALLQASLIAGSAVTAMAQAPWVVVNNTPPFAGFSNTISFQLPQANIVWWGIVQGAPRGTSESFAITSADNGQTWARQSVGSVGYVPPTGTTAGYNTGLQLIDLWAVNSSTAWMVLRDVQTGACQLQRTITGLQGFASITAPTSSIQYIRFFSATTGVAVGIPASGANAWPLFQTTDGGLTWASVGGGISLTGNDTPTSCAALGNKIWVGTSRGHVLHSTDAGQTWSQLATGLAAEVRSISFSDGLNGLAILKGVTVNDNSQLARTTDGGQTWSLSALSNSTPRVGVGAVPNSAGTYLRWGRTMGSDDAAQPGTSISTDYGVTWRDLDNVMEHSEIDFAPTGQAWSVQYGSGRLYRLPSSVLATKTSTRAAALQLYPNPSTGILHLTPAATARMVQIHDATGRLVLQQTLTPTNTIIDSSGLKSGIFRAVVRDVNGNASTQLVHVMQ